MSKKVLITGHLGFLYGAVIKHLLETTDYTIHGYDALTYAADKALDIELSKKYGKDRRYFSIVGDVGNVGKFSSYVEKFQPDLIIHAASETHVDNSINDPSCFIFSNIYSTYSVLEACREFKVPLIYQSTDEVLYHSRDHDNYEEEEYLNKFYPCNPYSASKASAEMLCMGWRHTFNMDITILRSTNVYGPRQHKEKFISRAIHNTLSGKPIYVYGEGLEERNYLYIDDFVEGVTCLIHRKLSTTYSKFLKRLYHISTHISQRNLDTANLIIKKIGKGNIQFVPNRPGHDPFYNLNCNEFTLTFQWRPKVSFSEGLDRTIAWYKQRYGIDD